VGNFKITTFLKYQRFWIKKSRKLKISIQLFCFFALNLPTVVGGKGVSSKAGLDREPLLKGKA
jgi:hypothetical protein